ncbi:hypothetical protein [Thermosynechococcus sp.]
MRTICTNNTVEGTCPYINLTYMDELLVQLVDAKQLPPPYSQDLSLVGL